MRTRMYGGVRGRKTKVGGKPTFVFLLLDFRRDANVTSLGLHLRIFVSKSIAKVHLILHFEIPILSRT